MQTQLRRGSRRRHDGSRFCFPHFFGGLGLLLAFSTTAWAQSACHPWLATPAGIQKYYPTAQDACSVYARSGSNSLGGTFIITSTAENFTGNPSLGTGQAQCIEHEVQTDNGTGICNTNPNFCHPADNIGATWQVPQGCGYYVTLTVRKDSEVCTANCQGDPINPALGIVYKTEEDLIEPVSGGLSFRRYFGSGTIGDLGAGPGDLSPDGAIATAARS